MSRNKITEFRNLLGQSMDSPEVKDQQSRLSISLTNSVKGLVYEIQIDENGKVEAFTPKELVSMYLASLKKTAIHVSHLSEEILSGIVLSIPAHFKKLQKMEVIDAAKNAGFKQVLTIKEPVAAALAFLGIFG